MEPYFVINAEELQSRPFIPPTFLVDGLIPQGVSLLCGPSKCGKSFRNRQEHAFRKTMVLP